MTSPSSSSGSGLNEIITFVNVATLTIPWNGTRKARFGNAAVFYVEILGDDGIYRPTIVEVKPDSIISTNSYSIDFGGLASGRVVIT